ncbi:MAG: GDYXXLXY domain-containing protein [Candidatus Hydrogenedentes bacterium]|nr:GDYXXLXY domain-containing protein [Candidatus Hydrogenedentota bacterium]
MKTLKLVLLGALALAQLAVPARMFLDQHAVLTRGERLKIRCAPLDPVNPFMGRYVQLNLSAEVAAPGTRPARTGEMHDAWVTYTLDEEGFVNPTALHWVRPKDTPSLKVRTWGRVDEGKTTFSYPFDRYYMNEKRAPEVDRLLMRGRFSALTVPAHVTVRVLGDTAVLEELFLDDKPVLEYLREHAGKAEQAPSGG